MNPFPSSRSAMVKYHGRLSSLVLVRLPVWQIENSEFEPTLLLYLKTDIVLCPVMEGLGKYSGVN